MIYVGLTPGQPWIGLVPRQNSTGGKERMGRISKQGDQYLRWLLVAGAMSVIKQAKRRGTTDPWLAGIIAESGDSEVMEKLKALGYVD